MEAQLKHRATRIILKCATFKSSYTTHLALIRSTSIKMPTLFWLSGYEVQQSARISDGIKAGTV
eukprot:2005598-Amphidinium_carterae.1